MLGCYRSIPLRLEPTPVREAAIMHSPRGPLAANRVIFLSDKEAVCPAACTRVEFEEEHEAVVSLIERRLQERGYSLVSGAIASRVEGVLKGTDERETWDRAEKLLLLGEKTGADAIFKLQWMFRDDRQWNYLKEANTEHFELKPRRIAEKAIEDWRTRRPYWWFRVFADSPSRYDIRVWVIDVSAKMIDLDGNVIWSGTKKLTTSDILPYKWDARLDGRYPKARIVTLGGMKDENFAYTEYFESVPLRAENVLMTIDSLISELPAPRPVN
jgi:hypothetical protein